jgi:hypothetical protein
MSEVEEKAWQFVRDTLKDEKKFGILRAGGYIHLTGNKGTNYLLYSSGHIVKLAADTPVLGKMIVQKDFAAPDYLATLIAWILHDEETLEKQWGCGNIYMDQDADEELAEDQIKTVRRVYGRRRRRRSLWDRLTHFFPFVAMIIVIIAIGTVVPFALNQSQPETAEAQENPGTTNEFTKFIESPAQFLMMALPLIIIMFAFLTLIKPFR